MRRSSYGSSHAANPDGSSSSTASDFFSPISIAYFQNHTPGDFSTPSSQMRLPPSHDNSWIGARLSPIHSFDREEPDDDDSDNDANEENDIHRTTLRINRRIWNDARDSSKDQKAFTTARKVPVHETPVPASSMDVNAPYPSTSQKSPPPSTNPNHITPSHPQRSSSDAMAAMGGFICTVSGIHLFGGMGFYDVLLSRQGEAWTWPYGIPSAATLIRWGAVSSFHEYNDESSSSAIWYGEQRTYLLSAVSSLIVCTSAMEWLLIVLAWRMLYISMARQPVSIQPDSRPSVSEGMVSHLSPPCVRYTWYQLGSIYLLSALVGQLWMWTYDFHFVAVGCVSWGTCGLLCTMGMSIPMYRFELFISAASLLMLSLLLRPYSSVHGTAGSACFGWALGALIYVEPHPLQDRHVLYVGNRNDVKGMKAVTLIGTAGTVLVVSLPVLILAFRP